MKYVCMLSNGDTVDPTGESSTCKFKLGKRLTNALFSVSLLISLILTQETSLLVAGAGEVISGWDLGIDGYNLNTKANILYMGIQQSEISPFLMIIVGIKFYPTFCRHACRWNKETWHSSPSRVSM